ncbi:MAG TPA: adenylate cyclase regulatory domain-containing protein, partial [Acidimicrobiales bacterium]|nr:adenylate cyclase regulatory domain-containing protein [Acidimicrobiales bacterium]
MTEPDWDELERLGLYEPDAPKADERRELLERYVERGVAIEELVAARERGRLITLLGDRGIRPSRDELTTVELAEHVGLDIELVEAAFRAAGLALAPRDLPYYGKDDVTLFEGFRIASDLFGTDELLRFVRAMGTAVSRVAAAAIEIAAFNYSG